MPEKILTPFSAAMAPEQKQNSRLTAGRRMRPPSSPVVEMRAGVTVYWAKALVRTSMILSRNNSVRCKVV